jgi:methyl-accepting chemotaxis protein
MNWFYNFKIAKKLFVTFSLVIIFAAGIGVFSIFKLVAVSKASADIAEDWLPSIKVLSKMQLSMARIRGCDFQHILYTEPALIAKVDLASKTFIGDLTNQQTDYSSMISNADEKALFEEIQANTKIFLKNNDAVLELSRAGKKEEAGVLMRGALTVTYQAALASIDKAVALNDAGAAASSQNARQTYLDARLWICVIVGIGIVVSLLLALWVARMIAAPLKHAVVIANGIAGGDLRASIKSESKDETGELMLALQTMNHSLLNIVGRVRNGTDAMATAAGEIAAGNMDLSSRTEQQASSLEETASSMEELTSTVKQNAENAHQANQLAVSATEVAIKGGVVVSQVVDTMGSINESAKKIVDIISVIDGIAFQTNILALNAAVEAARAGEQGRGFAVVASEVRSLAQRSASAAKEIKELISDSVAKTDVGTRLVNQAGITMNEVVDNIKRVTDVMSEITAASQEQTVGIEQINQAITQMDEVTQQNAALVEEAAAAAAALQDQTVDLSQVVSVFKLDSTYAVTSNATAGFGPRINPIVVNPPLQVGGGASAGYAR